MRRLSLILLLVALASPAWAVSWNRSLNGGAFQTAEASCTETPDASGNVYCVKKGTATTTGAVVKVPADGTSMTTDAGPTCSGQGALRYTGIGVVGTTLYIGCGSTTSTFNAKYATCDVASFGACSWSESSVGSGSCNSVSYACGAIGPFESWNSSSTVSWLGVHNTETTRLYDGTTSKAAIGAHQYSSHVSVARGIGTSKLLLQLYSGGYLATTFNSGFSISSGTVRAKSLSSGDDTANFIRGSAVSASYVMAVWKYGSNALLAVARPSDNTESAWWNPGFNLVPGIYGSEFTGSSRFAAMKTDGTCYVAGQDPPTGAFSSTAGCSITPDGGETVTALFKLGTTPVPAALTSGGDVWRFADPVSSGPRERAARIVNPPLRMVIP